MRASSKFWGGGGGSGSCREAGTQRMSRSSGRSMEGSGSFGWGRRILRSLGLSLGSSGGWLEAVERRFGRRGRAVGGKREKGRGDESRSLARLRTTGVRIHNTTVFHKNSGSRVLCN